MSLILFHAGLHKTGTSAIQEAFAVSIHSSRYRVEAVPASFIDAGELNPLWVQQLKRKAQRGTVIISSERILGEMMGCYGTFEDRASVLAEAFSDVDYRLVVYLRPQHDWFESAYVQIVQEGSELDPSILALRTLNSPALRYHEMVHKLDEICGPQRFQPIPYVKGCDAVASFFESFNLGVVPRVSRGRIVNPSISPLEALTVREASSPGAERVRIAHLLQFGVVSWPVDLEPIARESSSLNADLQTRLLEHTYADWKELAKCRRGDQWQSSILGVLDQIAKRRSQPPLPSTIEPAWVDFLIGLNQSDYADPFTEGIFRRLHRKFVAPPDEFLSAVERSGRRWLTNMLHRL